MTWTFLDVSNNQGMTSARPALDPISIGTFLVDLLFILLRKVTITNIV
jgi:hypothetical protein